MMDNIFETRRLLAYITGFLSSNSRLYEEYAQRLRVLEDKIDQPCVLAIAGKVKAGKSSFLNALLGHNLAKTGETETTATINIFKYGTPQDPEKPVKVVWDDGHCTFEPKGFMDTLQGHDEATLEMAKGIKWLEFFLENPILREITLVDTPGTGAIVGDNDDGHQKVTEKFFELRKKHNAQTVECTANADAVIYLVGPVPTMDGKTFLDDFRVATGGTSSAVNSIGVMSKVDIDQRLLACRNQQAEYLMSMDDCYLEKDDDVLDSLYNGTGKKSLSINDRTALKGDIPWSVFRTIATTLRTNDVDVAITQLQDIAGIPKVKEVIKRHFFDRAKLIRCFNITSSLDKMLFDMRNRMIPTILQGGWNNDTTKSMQRTCDDIKSKVDLLKNNLVNTDKRFSMQRLLERERPIMGNTDQYREMCVLFGIFDGDLPEDTQERLSYWNRVYDSALDHVIRTLAEYAVECYENINNNL